MPDCIVCDDTGEFINPFDQRFKCGCGGPKEKPMKYEDIKKMGEIKKTKSDGWKTDYYQLPKTAEEIQDLIEYKNMNFAVANIFKAAYRLGEKEGTTEVYDLNKIIFFAEREKDRLTKEAL